MPPPLIQSDNTWLDIEQTVCNDIQISDLPPLYSGHSDSPLWSWRYGNEGRVNLILFDQLHTVNTDNC